MIRRKKAYFCMAGLLWTMGILGFPAKGDNLVPASVNYQGQLTSPSTGQPVPDDSYEICFSIFDVETGGTPLWQECQTVTVSSGIFSVTLGETTALTGDVFSGKPRYLGIQVGTDPEMTPRKKLSSVPYALRAENAERIFSDDEILYGKWHALHGTFSVGREPMDVCFDGKDIWVANRRDNTVTRLDSGDGSLVGTYPVGMDPVAMAFDGTFVWVVNYDSDDVVRLNDNGEVQGSANVGASPVEILFDGTYMWVACFLADHVEKLNTDLSLADTITGVTRPAGLAFDGTFLWVSNNSLNNLSKIRASTGNIEGTYGVGSGPNILFSDGPHIWCHNQMDMAISKLRTSNGTSMGTTYPGFSVSGMVWDGRHLWVSRSGSDLVYQLSPGGAELGTFSVGTSPAGMCFDGKNIWVANNGDDTVSRIPAR